MNKSTQPLLSRKMILFLVGLTFAEATRAMTAVQIPVFLREIGASVSQVGLFFTLAAIVPLVLGVFGGWISDSIGRLRAILFGSLAGILGYLPFAFAHRWEVALLGPAILAVATSLIQPSFRAYIADTCPTETRGRVFGLSKSFITAAWIITPPLGGFLAMNFGSRMMFLTAVFLYGIAAVIFIFLLQSEKIKTTAPWEKPNLKSLRESFTQIFPIVFAGGLLTWILISEGIRSVATQFSFNLLPVYLSDIGLIDKQGIGVLDGLHGIAWVIASPIGGWLSDKSSERSGYMLGTAFFLSSFLVFILAEGFGVFGLSWIIMGIGGALLDPAYNALIARGAPAHLRGVAYALIPALIGLVALPSPWIGGQIWEFTNPKIPFLATFLLGSLALVPAWFKLRVTDKEVIAPAEPTL
ncbi:MAG TPA: MFS transporter [Anaerolineales bacterium]|nr:MFS transporter [Anaerolineales bacterium]HUS84285.1 MFS transporter [Anaerolineales bacterium]